MKKNECLKGRFCSFGLAKIQVSHGFAKIFLPFVDAIHIF